jgi:ABC-2 type transport system ATP-binding protein
MIQNGDRYDYQFFTDTQAANNYLESLTDKTGVMVRNSNLEDIFVRLTGHQLN